MRITDAGAHVGPSLAPRTINTDARRGHRRRSERVRRQGLEPRTRGLREGSCDALNALPAQTQRSYARKAPSAHSPHGFRSTRRSTLPHRTARELATESDDFGP